MTAMPAAGELTLDEFLTLRRDLPIHPQNLVDGELVVNQPPPSHQRIAGTIYFALRVWVAAEGGRGIAYMPLTIAIDHRNAYEPDVIWYQGDRGPTEDAPTSPLPDLAVEVRSPSTWRYDIGAKKAGYERAGLRELWLVDTPAREVLVFRRSSAGAHAFDVSLQVAAGEALTSPMLPGFALSVEDLFGSR